MLRPNTEQNEAMIRLRNMDTFKAFMAWLHDNYTAEIERHLETSDPRTGGRAQVLGEIRRVVAEAQ